MGNSDQKRGSQPPKQDASDSMRQPNAAACACLAEVMEEPGREEIAILHPIRSQDVKGSTEVRLVVVREGEEDSRLLRCEDLRQNRVPIVRDAGTEGADALTEAVGKRGHGGGARFGGFRRRSRERADPAWDQSCPQ